jgi:drug/metabolite transporter (DMT)-like permease
MKNKTNNKNRPRIYSESHHSVVSDSFFKEDFDFSNNKYHKNKSMIFDSLISNENSYMIKKDNFKAIIIMFIATLVFSIVNLIGKFIGFYYPEVIITATNFIRGLMLISLSHIYFHYKEINPIKEIFDGKAKIKILFLSLRCLCGMAGNILLFLAFKYMRISSAFTIFQLMPIVVSFLLWIFLNGQLTKLDIAGLIICLISVCLIVKPDFMFGDLGKDSGDSFIGVIFSLLSLIFNSFSVFFTKIIANDFHFSIAPYLMGYLYSFSCGLIVILSENGFETLSIVPIVLSILMGFLFFINLYCFIFSVGLGDPIKTLPMTYLGVVMTLIFNVFIFHQGIDFWDLLGSFTIITVNIYLTISVKK